jgi:hypothetical protein
MSIRIDGLANTITDTTPSIYLSLTPGTLMLFQQTTAPIGWTKQTTHNDKSLRVVSGSASSGGTTAFSSVFTSRAISGTIGNTTLAANQLGNHTHAYTVTNSGNASVYGVPYYVKYAAFVNSGGYGANTGGINEGSGNAHTHSLTGNALDFAVQYVDLIIASKN